MPFWGQSTVPLIGYRWPQFGGPKILGPTQKLLYFHSLTVLSSLSHKIRLVAHFIMPATKRLLYRARQQDAKRRRTTGSLASAVRALAESKYKNVDVSHSITSASTTTLTDISTGDGPSTRDGRKVLITSVSLKLTNSNGYPVRVTLYVPKNPSTSLSLTNWYDAIENDEFWVLHDYIYQTNDVTGANSTIVNFNMARKLTVEYSDTTGTSAVRSPIKMLLSTPTNSTINGHTKVWFKDI